MSALAAFVAATFPFWVSAVGTDTPGPAPSPAASSEAQESDTAQDTEKGELDAALKFEDQVVVTAGKTEQRVRDLPVQVTVLTTEDIQRSAGQTVADLLLAVPSVSLQRGGSTRTTNLATAAPAVRSIGGGSVSRTLVLVDGVPLNDAFLGWIPWSQVSRASVERIEVVPAGGGGAWGNQALGGVIHILTRRPERTAVSLDGRLGSLKTAELDVGATYVRGPVSFSPHVAYFDTDGYIALAEEARGQVDIRSGTRSYLLGGGLEYNPSPGARWVMQATFLDDDRSAGTPLAADHMEITALRSGADIATRGGGSLSINAFGRWRGASSTRGSVNAGRTVQVLSRSEFDMPSSSLGLGASWSYPLTGVHLLSAGADVQRTEGEVNDDSRYVSGHFTRRSITGGKQVLLGIYAQDTVLVGSRWRAVAGGRLDLCNTSDGKDFAQDLDSGAVLRDEHASSRSQWIFNPNLGLLFRASHRLALRGSVYRTFRAPNPNELYRPVQTGRSFNQPNDNLEPERITAGFEAGVDWAVTRMFSSRVTGFWNEFANAITDVTVGTAGPVAEEVPPCGLIPAGASCRQKQNLDRVRNRGAELELQLRPHRALRLAAAYTYASATVTSAPNAPQLVGNRLRRVPEHQFSLRAEYSDPSLLTASLVGRYQGDRYQDDLNRLYIDDSFVLDLFLSRRVSQKVELYGVVENLLDTDFEIDRSTDGIEYGHPRGVHAGLRLRWPGRGPEPREP